MTHSRLKNAVRAIAHEFEVSYQHAKTRIQKVIAQGAITNLQVVHAQIDLETWLKIGFKLIWHSSEPAAEAGVGGPQFARLPGQILALRNSSSPEMSPLVLLPDERDGLLEAIEHASRLIAESAPADLPAVIESNKRPEQADPPTD